MRFGSNVKPFRAEDSPPIDALGVFSRKVDVLPVDHPLAEVAEPVAQFATVQARDERLYGLAEHLLHLGGIWRPLVSHRGDHLRHGLPRTIRVDHFQRDDELSQPTRGLVGLLVHSHARLAKVG